MISAPMHRIWALLLLPARSAETGSWQSAARIPFTLLAAMVMPLPVPHTSTALGWLPASTCPAT
ncbi:hypothetical protein D3C76_1814770 [compost metagenome]